MLNRHPSPRSRPTPARRVALAAIGTSIVALGPGIRPAAAGSVETGNACYYSFDNYYRDLDITLEGAAIPNPLAPGETATLTATFSGSMPAWLPQYGRSYGLLEVGENRIPTTIWVAIEGIGSVEGIQVVSVDVDALTIVDDPDGTPGTGDEGGTPPAVEVELPATTWTSTGAPIELRQAGGATLPVLSGAGPEGQDLTPQGSAFISAQLATLTFDLDCQPGEYDAATRGETFIAAEAAPFDVVEAGVATPATEAEASTTTESLLASPPPSEPTTTAPVEEDSEAGSSPGLIIGVVVAILVVGGAVWYVVSRRATPTHDREGHREAERDDDANDTASDT